MVDHARHGAVPEHVMARASRAVRVAYTTMDRRYGEFLRRWELDSCAIILSERDREVCRPARSLQDAHAALTRTGRIVPFALFERAVWRDGGDRDLVELRKSEIARRVTMRDATGCDVCGSQTRRLAAAA